MRGKQRQKLVDVETEVLVRANIQLELTFLNFGF